MQSFITSILLLILSQGLCCFFTFRKSPTESPATLSDEYKTSYSAKSTRSRFYIEVEEGPNHVTTINAIKKLPPMQSQKLDSGIVLDEYVLEPEPPSIQSQIVPTTEDEVDLSTTTPDPRDADIQKDWRGSCDAKHWDVCSQMEEIHVRNVHNKTKEGKTTLVHLQLNCINLNITCLSNGWTVNRCQLICMSKCNTEMLQKYDEYVDHDGPCNYT